MSLIPSGLAKSTAEAAFYSQEIGGSLRFNMSESPDLTKSMGTATDGTKCTISFWIKKNRSSNSTTTARFMSAYSGTGNQFHMQWGDGATGDGDQWNVSPGEQSSNQGMRMTTASLRDPSAWYHCVWSYNSTSGSESVVLYVNGVAQTSSYTDAPTTGLVTSATKSGTTLDIGYVNSSSLDITLAEMHLIDGQALDPTSFGEFKSGVWIPKAYSGAYGNNGFYFDFISSNYSNPNMLDSSGNGNNFAASGGINAHDFVLDSPTLNWATWNGVNTNGTLSQGNLQAAITDNRGTLATFSMPEGKWYWEVMHKSGNSHISIASDGTPVLTQSINDTATKAGTYYYDGRYYKNGVQQGTASSLGTDDILAMTYDSSTRQWTVYKNNSSTSEFTLTLDALTGGNSYAPALGSGGTPSVIGNFGQDSTFAGSTTAGGNSDENGYGDFKYAVPSGFLALCAANLTLDAAIDPAEDASPEDYFDIDTYSGTSATHERSNFSFQPDFVWIKERNNNGLNHCLFDAVRGATKIWYSNDFAVEATNANTLTSFDSDGFTLGTDGNNYGVNRSVGTYVAWAWKANGSGSDSTSYMGGAGSGASATTSVNTTAGFSITKYYIGTSPDSYRAVPHLLGSVPDMIFVKNLDDAEWPAVQHSSLSANSYLNSGTTATQTTDVSYFRTGYFDANTFTVGSANETGKAERNFIAYSFKSVTGFSAFGSYEGNGGSGGTSGYDGTFVYTGFKPSFVLVKNIDAGWNWIMWDSARDTYNQVNGVLQTNTTDDEYDVGGYMSVDFLSNGFKIRSDDAQENGLNNTHIYMAFAESPFKYATAR